MHPSQIKSVAGEILLRNGVEATPNTKSIFQSKDKGSIRVKATTRRELLALNPIGDKSSILGTDYILLLMPTKYKPNEIEGYLMPTAKANEAMVRNHKEWIKDKPEARNKWLTEEYNGSVENSFGRLFFNEERTINEFEEYYLLEKVSLTEVIEEPPQAKEGRVKKAQSTGEGVLGEAKELIARRLGVPLEKVQLEIKLVD